MRLPLLALTLTTTLSVPLLFQTAAAQSFYRYTNDKGHTVISNTLPSQYARKGYEILDSRGQVLNIVAPALTAEQKRALAQQEEALRKKDAQKARDNELLSLYSSPDEARSALKRQVDELKTQVQLTEGVNVRLRSSLKNKREQIGRIEKAGNPIPEKLSNSLQELLNDLSFNEQAINQLKNKMEQLRLDFHTDIKRLEALLKKQDVSNGTIELAHITESLLEGSWRNREELWLDWNLNSDGSFSSFRQELGSGARIEKQGEWELNGSRLIFTIHQQTTTDASGRSKKKRVAEEIRSRIMEADSRSMVVYLDGQTLSLNRQ